jgi:predicted DCC family thiol-disulfide oxidoreductase YuxK
MKTEKRDMSSCKIEVFFDGDCPLCKREIGFLKRKDKRNLIRFSDIQTLDRSRVEIDKSYQQLMAEIHGRLPDGTWITGVEVFRELYSAIGWNWAVAPTRWPIIRQILDWGYGVFAPRRLALTGRCVNVCEERAAE